MNNLVMLLSDDDTDLYENPVWCLVDPANAGGPATLCTGEYFGLGESFCTYKRKSVKKGGITCPRCIAALKAYKSIRL